MRHALVVFLALVLVGTLFWWFQSPEIDVMVPSELAGLVIVNRLPDSLDFLPRTRLGEWLDVEPVEIEAKLNLEIDREWVDEFRKNLVQAAVILHSLQRRESGSFRPHFTGLLRLRRGWQPYVEEWLEQEVLGRFGEDQTKILEQGPVKVFQGEQDGQIFYMSSEDGWLIFSNSKRGWEAVQLTLAGRRPSLKEIRSFQEVRERVDDTSDLFFYFSGLGTEQFLPEFGYSVRLEGDQVDDSYWAVER